MGEVVVMGVCVKKMKVCPLVYPLKVILLLPICQIFLKTESFHVLSLDPESILGTLGMGQEFTLSYLFL